MANISRNTFNKLKHYVNVRMQQGVPLVDADCNEQDDIRKHELELFLKWFVGNGVPKNNEGFRILPRPGFEHDFIIKGGDGPLGDPGICLVDGWELRAENHIAYRDQVIYTRGPKTPGEEPENPLQLPDPPPEEEPVEPPLPTPEEEPVEPPPPPDAEPLEPLPPPDAELLETPPPPPEEEEPSTDLTGSSTCPYTLLAELPPNLSIPLYGERTDLVYIDAWEREVDGWEDSSLVNPAIGIQTCVRMKREWVVRVAEGTTDLPATVPQGHVFYPLATIVRRAGQPEILQGDITDLRRTGVNLGDGIEDFETYRTQNEQKITELETGIASSATKEEFDTYRTQNDEKITGLETGIASSTTTEDFDAYRTQMGEKISTMDTGIANIGSKMTLLSAGGIDSPSVTLSSVNTWGDFPDLTIEFTTLVTRKVMVSFQISMAGGNSHLCTRLMADDVEVSRNICGDTHYWDISQTWSGELAEGDHVIKVQYRTPYAGTNDPVGTDYENRLLQVMVMGELPQPAGDGDSSPDSTDSTTGDSTDSTGDGA